jgi:hypothetical protein
MTRVAGASAAAASAAALISGISTDKQVQRNGARIVALHSGFSAGFGVAQMCAPAAKRVGREDRLIPITAFFAANAAFMAWRGFRKDDD